MSNYFKYFIDVRTLSFEDYRKFIHKIIENGKITNEVVDYIAKCLEPKIDKIDMKYFLLKYSHVRFDHYNDIYEFIFGDNGYLHRSDKIAFQKFKLLRKEILAYINENRYDKERWKYDKFLKDHSGMEIIVSILNAVFDLYASKYEFYACYYSNSIKIRQKVTK